MQYAKLSCNQYNAQYVGETTLPLHTRIDVQSRAESECENVIKDFKDVCVCACFSVQIMKVFPGTEYKNKKVCIVNHETRLDRKVC